MQRQTNLSEELRIREFLDLVAEMFSRSDYLLPLAAGQRQFRQDNYQMASASQLEDLFFDAFGMFLRENHPGKSLVRRTGNEAWDYAFDGLELSHKETLSRGIAVWWTAGRRDPDSGRYLPLDGRERYTSPCPIVLVYSGTEAIPYRTKIGGHGRTGRLRGTLGGLVVKGERASAANQALVLATLIEPGRLQVDRVLRPEEWAEREFFDLWPTLGGDGLESRDLWVDRSYSDRRVGLAGVATLARGASLDLGEGVLPAGVYVLTSQQLTAVPVVANNRAHSVEQGHLDGLLRSSLLSGFYRPFPLWFAHFASAPPPNLYVRQRAQYEQLFSARQRVSD